jgi:hypothetical protein
MRLIRFTMGYLLAGVLVSVCYPLIGFSQTTALQAKEQSGSTARGGQHDFDFEIGTWKTHLRRLLNPLTGSTT